MTAEANDLATQCRVLIQELERDIRERDPGKALRSAREAVESGSIPITALYSLVLAPLLRLVGARWQSGEEEVWEEHYTTTTVRTIVESMSAHVHAQAAQVETNGHAAVFACPEEEYHDLGLRMLVDRFSLAGYRTYFLGAALPLEQLLAAVRDLEVDTVVVSASTHFHRMRLREYVDAVHEHFPDVRVMAGGPAFAHGHADWTDDEVPDINDVLGDLKAVE